MVWKVYPEDCLRREDVVVLEPVVGRNQDIEDAYECMRMLTRG